MIEPKTQGQIATERNTSVGNCSFVRYKDISGFSIAFTLCFKDNIEFIIAEEIFHESRVYKKEAGADLGDDEGWW